MRKNKKQKTLPLLPENMLLKEASVYWDKHSFFDFDDVKEVEFDVELTEEKNYILLEKEVAIKIHQLSIKKKKSEHILVNEMLKKSLSTSL